MVTFPTKAKYHVICWKPSTYAACLCIELCQTFVDLCWEFYHTLKIKVTYTPPNMCYTSTLEVSKSMSFHFHQINHMFVSMIFLHNLYKWAWAMKKKVLNKEKSRKKCGKCRSGTWGAGRYPCGSSRWAQVAPRPPTMSTCLLCVYLSPFWPKFLHTNIFPCTSGTRWIIKQILHMWYCFLPLLVQCWWSK
jgi:hypothetical protein